MSYWERPSVVLARVAIASAHFEVLTSVVEVAAKVLSLCNFAEVLVVFVAENSVAAGVPVLLAETIVEWRQSVQAAAERQWVVATE